MCLSVNTRSRSLFYANANVYYVVAVHTIMDSWVLKNEPG